MTNLLTLYKSNMGQEFKINDCGEIIREEHNSKKTNWWAIISFFLFITVCTLSFIIYHSYKEISYLRLQQDNSINMVSEVNGTLLLKEEEINRLKEQIQSNEDTIINLRNQLPKTYYTKYSNQAIYYWDLGTFIRANSFWENSDIRVTIYLQKEGYGMTEFGWIPMDCLKE